MLRRSKNKLFRTKVCLAFVLLGLCLLGPARIAGTEFCAGCGTGLC
jgi:hypothetical protein